MLSALSHRRIMALTARLSLAVALGYAGAGCAAAGSWAGQGVEAPAARRGADPALPAATLLSPGDMVRLRIWREPDLSGDFLVDRDRVLVFPKIGAYRIGGETGEEFKQRLIAAYDEYLRNPSIEVSFLRRVGVQGAVRTPGLYNADLTLSVADVLALAGGVASDGDPSRIDIVRNGTRQRATVARSIALAETPIRSGDHIYVHRESWLRRNTAAVAGVASSFVGLLLILATR